MDWQQPVALTVVASTVGMMLWLRLRRGSRVGRSAGGCGCGCPSAGSVSPAERVIYRARRGERPQWIVARTHPR